MDRKSWLKSLKVGDDFAIAHRFSDNSFTVYTITGETKTRWKSGTRQYTKSDGCSYPRDAWSSVSMQPVTDEVISSIRKGNLVRIIEGVKWSGLDVDKLEKIAAIIKDGE
jgi:hypothetical protein